MSFPRDHEVHKRRRGRNLGVGLVLVAFAAVIFGLTIAKVDGPVQGFDHIVRPELDEEGQ